MALRGGVVRGGVTVAGATLAEASGAEVRGDVALTGATFYASLGLSTVRGRATLDDNDGALVGGHTIGGDPARAANDSGTNAGSPNTAGGATTGQRPGP